jgi:hypothetical protein
MSQELILVIEDDGSLSISSNVFINTNIYTVTFKKSGIYSDPKSLKILKKFNDIKVEANISSTLKNTLHIPLVPRLENFANVFLSSIIYKDITVVAPSGTTSTSTSSPTETSRTFKNETSLPHSSSVSTVNRFINDRKEKDQLFKEYEQKFNLQTKAMVKNFGLAGAPQPAVTVSKKSFEIPKGARSIVINLH